MSYIKSFRNNIYDMSRIKESAAFCNLFCNREGAYTKVLSTKIVRTLYNLARWRHVVRVSALLFLVVQILERRKTLLYVSMPPTPLLLYNPAHD